MVGPFITKAENDGVRRSLAMTPDQETERARIIAEIEAVLHLLEPHELRDLQARTVAKIGARS